MYDESTSLEANVLEAWLAGKRGPILICRYLGLDCETDTLSSVQRVISSHDFQARALEAVKATDTTVTNWIKARALKYVRNVDVLADTASDPRVQLQANTALLDRIGISGTQKVQVTTLEDYASIAGRYAEKQEDR